MEVVRLRCENCGGTLIGVPDGFGVRVHEDTREEVCFPDQWARTVQAAVGWDPDEEDR